MSGYAITTVGEGDLDDLLPLMRAYCDFYEVAPVDPDLLGMSRALIADPDREGVQLIARDADGAAGEAQLEFGGVGGVVPPFGLGVGENPLQVRAGSH